MKQYLGIALGMVAGGFLGAAAVTGLHAQAKAPVYSVTEIDVTNIDAYTKEYAPLAQASIKNLGGKLLAAGQKVTSLEGDPPKSSRFKSGIASNKHKLGAIQPTTKQLE